MEKKKNKGGLVTLVIVLFLLVLGLGGYIVYDKLLDNKALNKDNTNLNSSEDDNSSNQSDKDTNSNQIEESNYDTSWIKSWRIDNCSYEIIPYIEALLINLTNYNEENKTYIIDFTKYNSKDNKLIKSVLNYYLETTARKNGFGVELENGEYRGTYSINIEKNKLDSITKTIFNTDGLSDYSDVYREKYGLIKINDNYYKVAWYATDGSSIKLYNVSFDTNNDDVYIIADTHYESAGGGGDGNLGKIKVTVGIDKKYNTCHISKIENNN